MSKLLRWIAGFVFIVILGCASAPITPTMLAKSDLDAGNGLLAGSISRAPGIWPYSTYVLYFREIGQDDAGGRSVKVSSTNSVIDLGKHKFDDDYVSDRSSGAIFANVLPPGEYEFYQYYLFMYGGGVQRTLESAEEFSVRFNVVAGQILYIGEFRAEPMQAKNMFGMKIPDGVDWTLHNNQARDIALLFARFPDLAGTPSESPYAIGCASIYDC